MSNTVIKVQNLSKIYRLGEIGTGTVSRDMERWFKTKVLKQEDPFFKIGETNDRNNRGTSDIVYSLRDINFEIQQGDAVGIIGRNGAGKSTLLKILSRVTTPSTGKIKIKGRVASLLEVGTGFHPELTGRENIYLNGAILGMSKREINRKIDEIIDFSGVERYIDTPVKRYSSGMYVRLAFAVAAHLESEILIVDEVLAVGDAEFQKKCLGKMGEVSKGQGRTILFVSHNLAAIRLFCPSALLLENGHLDLHTDIDNVISKYNDQNKSLPTWKLNENLIGLKNIQITRVSLNINGKQPLMKLVVDVEIRNEDPHSLSAFFALYISSSDSTPLMEAIPGYGNILFNHRSFVQTKTMTVDLVGLIPGIYVISLWLGHDHTNEIDYLKEILNFEIVDYPMVNRTINYPGHAGFMVPVSNLH